MRSFRTLLLLGMGSLIACGSSVATPTSSAASTSGSSSSSGGSGGGTDGQQCATAAACGSGHYCVNDHAGCAAGSVGICFSDGIAQCDLGPVCGCDGMTYPTVCDAEKAGVVVSSANTCAHGSDEFPCGFTFCKLATEFCFAKGDIGFGYSCEPLPMGCSACDCLPVMQCSTQSCTGTMAEGLTLTCG